MNQPNDANQTLVNRKETITMNKETLHNTRLKGLTKGKAKKLGFFEAIKPKLVGRRDGVKGLPRQDKNDYWNSAFIDQEINSYEEFSTSMWATLQMESEESFARLNELYFNVLKTHEFLEEAKLALSRESSLEIDTSRRTGEEQLSVEKVVARRTAEREKRLVPLKSKIASYECKIAENVEEFNKLHSRLAEDSNTTRLICNQVKDHTLQKLDVYWNAALKKHPQSAEMPVVPAVVFANRAEQTYMELHAKLMKCAEAMSVQGSDCNEDKEVA